MSRPVHPESKRNRIKTSTQKSDVVIVGGGVIGSAIAYFLAADNDFRGSILVVERDPAYIRCSTTLSVGGIRQQFSTPENIEISRFGAQFFKRVREYLAVGDKVPELSFREAGYLLLASPQGLSTLTDNYELQKAHHVDLDLLSPDGLKHRFPWMNVADLGGGTLGLKNEGWVDPYSLLMGFKDKAQSIGASYIKDEVIGLARKAGKVDVVRLSERGKIACGTLVNAAGPGAARIAAFAGIPALPVHPRKRCVFTFECRAELPGCPLMVDPSGVYFRPESGKFLCGVSPPANHDPDCHDLRVDPRLFEEAIWPVLANRVPAFQALERGFSWAGHYAYNVIDKNAILGPHPEVENFYFANGFSGHGLQQAPAVGRAISELIASGSYQTLDLSRFSFARFAAKTLIHERNIV
ncbi:MAG: NAD(P)/FAD-dependent oxidoreductase [bacterium]